MGKFLVLAGYFLTGVSTVGLFSYTAYAFESLRMYSFWLVTVVALLFIAAALADDFLASALGLTYSEYIGTLVSAITVILIGGVLMWVH
jgi:hypothetical protein